MGIIPPCITEHHTTKIYGVAEWSALPWYRWHIMLGGCARASLDAVEIIISAPAAQLQLTSLCVQPAG